MESLSFTDQHIGLIVFVLCCVCLVFW